MLFVFKLNELVEIDNCIKFLEIMNLNMVNILIRKYFMRYCLNEDFVNVLFIIFVS